MEVLWGRIGCALEIGAALAAAAAALESAQA
jgi:hypothetical protein